ncbi:MAG: beta-phosphoglucomutase-like phosphatase (HAD superfamily) [Flavobacteriales bacterium]|jgi:beta-phosphoglucomutase-like phosphatase (HAD superfamily)
MKLAVFDFDGTLTDSTQLDDQCIAATFTHFLGPKATCNWQAITHVTDPIIVRENASPVNHALKQCMKK